MQEILGNSCLPKLTRTRALKHAVLGSGSVLMKEMTTKEDEEDAHRRRRAATCGAAEERFERTATTLSPLRISEARRLRVRRPPALTHRSLLSSWLAGLLTKTSRRQQLCDRSVTQRHCCPKLSGRWWFSVLTPYSPAAAAPSPGAGGNPDDAAAAGCQ